MAEQLIIVRAAAELGTKARQTRSHFQTALRRNVATALRRAGASCTLTQDFGRLYLATERPEVAMRVLPRVFGIDNFSVVDAICAPDLSTILDTGEATFGKRTEGQRFAVRAKRLAGASLSTQLVNEELGRRLKARGGIVDLEQPAITVAVEISPERCLMFAGRRVGAKGLPVGVGGKVVALLSGGFDSAVAAWRVLRRGLKVDYVFCNLGGGAYERMVLQVAKVLNDAWGYGHNAHVHVVDFTASLADIRAQVPAQFWQVVLKRQMYRAASAIADAVGAEAIVTGEALGQVSSQTLANLCAIEPAATKPVLRPLIARDKQEIIDEAERVGTAAISRRIKEYCALGASRPVVATTAARIDAAESSLDRTVLDAAVAERRDLDLGFLRPADLRAPYLFTERIPTGAVLIDCQDAAAFERWHLAGAIHWEPTAVLERMHEFDKGRVHVIYCAHGVTSAGVAEVMQQAGFEAYAFGGGLNALRRLVAEAAA